MRKINIKEKSGLHTVVPNSMNYIELISAQLIFGINFFTSKIIVKEMSPFFLALLRCTFSFIFLLIIYSFKKKDKHDDFIRSHSFAILLALFGFTLGQGPFLYGLKIGSVTNISILSITIPLFTYIVSLIRKTEKLTRYKLIGIIISIFGISILKKLDQLNLNEIFSVSDLIVLFACLTTAIYISYSKDYFKFVQPERGTMLIFFYASIQFLIVNYFWGDFNLPAVMSHTFISSLAFTIIFASTIAYILINRAFKHFDASIVSTYIFIQPLTAAMFGVAFLGEQLNFRIAISFILIMMGVLVISKKEKLS